MNFMRNLVKDAVILIAITFFSFLIISSFVDPKEHLIECLESDNYKKVVKIYNSKILGTKDEDGINELIKKEINTVLADMDCGELSANSAAEYMQLFFEINNNDIKLLAEKNYEIVVVEGFGVEFHSKAEEHYEKNELAHAMSCVSKIDKRYSQYNDAIDLYNTSESIILESVSEPYSSQDCEDFSNQLEEYLKIVDNKKFEKRRKNLQKKEHEYKEAESIVKKAAELYDKKKYSKCFESIEKGIKKYPDNNLLKLSLDNSHDLYIINVTEKVYNLCENENYGEALNILTEARAIYNCSEFNELIDSVLKQKSKIYNIASNIYDKLFAFTHNTEGERLSVIDMGEKTGSYVIKSGKKICLGDYSSEEVTMLSFGGSILASLTGIDLIMDIRDLSYDAVHWGESDYFLVDVAVDAVALIPVIGAVKYLKMDGAKNTEDAFKVGFNSTKWIKDGEKVVDTVNTIRLSKKPCDNIEEAVKRAKPAKVLNVIKKQHVRYKSIPTINQRFVGKVNKMDVKYVKKRVQYSDKRKLSVVVPKFKYVYKTNISNDLYLKDRGAHFSECNRNLSRDIENNPLLKKKFSEEQLNDIADGKTPSGYTWHHSENEGELQLVDTEEHYENRHTGGFKLWGKGSTKTAA